MTPERWVRVKEVFGAARERPAEARAAFLAAACGEDGALRQEVAELLAAAEASASATPSLTGPGEEAPGAPPPVTLGPYRVLRELGHGGMGTVYLAERQDEAFRKTVAVKVIRRGMDTASVVARFRHERQILAGLAHPNIAALLDGGATEGGQPWLAMEHIEGERIDRWCEARGLGVEARLRLFLPVCAAVQHAHARLVVHRDLKPGNVLVDGAGVPKLLDFGLAKLLDGREDAEATATQLRFYTPGYASPEQVRGERVTTASDVYSLGALLYALLTGAAPPEGAEAPLCSEAVPEPRLKRLLKGDLDAVVRKAMARSPEDRYRSADELAGELRSHLEGRPVAARRGTPAYLAWRFARRHKVVLTAGALVVASLAVGLVSSLRQQRRAEQHFAEVRRLANAHLFELHEAIRTLPGATPARKLVLERAQEYLALLEREASGDVGLERELAEAYLQLGELQGSPNSGLGDFAGARANLLKAVALREAVVARRPDDVDDAFALVAAQAQLGQLKASVEDPGAVDDLRRALALAEEVERRRPGDDAFRQRVARAAFTLALTLSTRGQPSEALTQMRRYTDTWEALARAAPGERRARRNLALGLKYQGTYLQQLGQPAQALALDQRALELDEALVREAPEDAEARLDLSFSLGSVASVLGSVGDHRGELLLRWRALELREQMAAADPANFRARRGVASARARLAETLVRLGQPEEALEQAGAASSILRALSGVVPVGVLQGSPAEASVASAAAELELGAREGPGAQRDQRCARARAHLLEARGQLLTAPAAFVPELLAPVERAVADCEAWPRAWLPWW